MVFSTSSANDYPDIEIVLGTGALNNDDSRAIGHLMGLPEEFYRKTYGSILGKVFDISKIFIHNLL